MASRCTHCPRYATNGCVQLMCPRCCVRSNVECPRHFPVEQGARFVRTRSAPVQMRRSSRLLTRLEVDQLKYQMTQSSSGSHSEPFRKQYRAYPISRSVNFKASLEEGDKIFLPASAFQVLSQKQVTYPMTFKIVNPLSEKHTHCGVVEFTAFEFEAYIPTWMMENLDLSDGDIVDIKSVNLQKGQFVVFQAHKMEFTKIPNPKAILENNLRKHTCLTKGDTISVKFGEICYKLDVHETKPDQAITVIDTDVKVDFLAPKDMKEEKEREAARRAAVEAKDLDEGNVRSESIWGSKVEKGSEGRTASKASYFKKLTGGVALGKNGVSETATSRSKGNGSSSSRKRQRP